MTKTHTLRRAVRYLTWPACALLLSIGIGMTFFWVYADPSQGRFLGIGDAWTWNGPTCFYFDYAIHKGEFPLWNPLVLCGEPFAANPQAFVFYPPNLLRSLLTFNPTPMKTHIGMVWLLFFHLLLAGMSAYALARHYRLSFAASLTVAIGYVFSAPMVSRAGGHWQFIMMIAWLPLLFLFASKMSDAHAFRDKVRYSLMSGLVLGMLFLGGSPHMMVVAAFALAWYWFLYGCVCIGRMRDPSLSDLFKTVRNDAIALLLVLLIGTLAASAMLLPAYKLSKANIRSGKDGVTFATMKNPPERVDWNLFQTLTAYSGTQDYEGIRASGAGILFCALAAIVCARRSDVIVPAGLFLVLLDCSLEKPLCFGRMLHLLSPFAMSSPGRAMLAACLPLSLLAGMGIDGILAPSEFRRWKAIRTVVVVVAGAAVLYCLGTTVSPHPFLKLSRMALYIPVVLCVCAILAIWFTKPVFWGVVIAALIMGESLTWNHVYIKYLFSDAIVWKGDMAELKSTPTFWNDNRRGTNMKPNCNMYKLRPAINGYNPLNISKVRDVLCAPENEDLYFREVWFWEPTKAQYRGNLFLKRSFWLARQFAEGRLPLKMQLYPVATTIFLEDPPKTLHTPRIDRKLLPRTSVSAQRKRVVIMSEKSKPAVLDAAANANSKKGVMARATIPEFGSGHAAIHVTLSATVASELQSVFVRKEDGLSELGISIHIPNTNGKNNTYEIPLPYFKPDFLVLKPKFTTTDGQITIHSMDLLCDLSDEDHLISVVSRSANRVTVTTGDLSGYRLLLFVDAYYPGWRARVDGNPTKIFKANDVFKAIELPPGTHDVEFVFSSSRCLFGAAVSILTVMGCVAFFVNEWRREPRRQVSENS